MKETREKVIFEVILGILLVFLLAILSPFSALAETPLQKLIEGAKKEGVITMIDPTGYTAKSFTRLRTEIKQKFDVDLKFEHVPGWFATDLSKAISEHKSGVSPTWDLAATYAPFIGRYIEAGILEKVDWESLLLPGTPREMILGIPPEPDFLHGYGIKMATVHDGGIVYNPTKIPLNKVPQTQQDLAQAWLKGRVAANKLSSAWWWWWGIFKGKDYMLGTLREFVKNGALFGNSPENMNRYLMGEVDIIAFTSSSFSERIRRKGKPAEYTSLDISLEVGYPLIIRKGVPHPNAAKLVAVYLASPEGFRLTFDEAGNGNLFYAGNYDHDIQKKDKERGLTMINVLASKIIPFATSKEALIWEKEIEEIMAGR